MLIRGKCHCGNLSFSLSWEPEPETIPARSCGCGFCVKHGGVWTSNPRGHLKIMVRDPASVSKYEFGTRTAQFQVCTRCGVVPLVTSRIEGREYAVVNVNTFEGVARSLVRPSPADFEGEGQDDRLARRQRNWIANVEYTDSSGSP